MRPSISVAIIGLLWLSAYAYAQPNKELYELQERCGIRAAEIFRQEYIPVYKTKDSTTLVNYENHYSPQLNKCFFLEIAVSYGKTRAKIMRLYDLNERSKEYGTFMNVATESTPVECVVRGKDCQSESEWRQLLKPFMED